MKTKIFLTAVFDLNSRQTVSAVFTDVSVLPDFTFVSPQFSVKSKNSSSPLLLMVVCRARHWPTEVTGLHQDGATNREFSLVGAK